MRVGIYARVSSEEQVEGYSLDAQLRAGRSFVAERGWDIFREYVEEGRSAHTDDIRKRPVFKEAVEDALAGRYDVLVVHKIDRFSRKLRFTLEYFDKLYKAGVGFVSISEQMDFTTPTGQVFLAMVGAFSQFYSDNLSQETKKGWAERKAQGLYCGLLPFGARKGEDGLPEPDPETYPGLALAFREAANGKSDREVAMILNAAGYRTAGNMGNNAFSKDTVRGVLTNRFYVGELPEANGDWMPARHAAFIDKDVFERVQQARARNRSRPRTVRLGARVYSLSGLLRCVGCEGPMWIHQNVKGRARIYCRNRAQGLGCNNRATFLDIYEYQVLEYLRGFTIPEDYQRQILAFYARLQDDEHDGTRNRRQLEAHLARARKLYEWGDKSEEEYLSERRQIKSELERLQPHNGGPAMLERLAHFLADVAAAWQAASPEQRNRLARQLLDAVWVRNDKVVAVRPRPELRPFFALSEECHGGSMSGDPEGIRTPDLQRDKLVC